MISHLPGTALAVMLLATPDAPGARPMVSECEVFFPAANAHTFSIQIPPGEFAKRRKDTRSGVKFDVTVEVSFFAEHCGVHLQGGFGPPRPRKGTR